MVGLVAYCFNQNDSNFAFIIIAVEAVGGKCLPVQCDLRDENAVKSAFDQAVQKFGSIDILINNASAISLTGRFFAFLKYDSIFN